MPKVKNRKGIQSMTFVNFLTNFQLRDCKIFSLLALFCWYVPSCFSQEDSLSLFDASPKFNRNRAAFVVGGTSALGVGLLSGLSYSWYKDFNTSSFHFFDDGSEWMGMDKLGHVVTAYQVSDYLEHWYLWSGQTKAKSRTYSALTSLSFLTAVEVLDGFSQGWGFSNADMLSNVMGVGAFLCKSKFSPKGSFSLKYGFFPSELRKLRPELLGKNQLTSLIKDYNGQSYWLSFNLSIFRPKSRFPNWINMAFGYGASGLLGGKSNPEFNESGMALPKLDRYAQFFISADVDWNKIPTKNKYLKFVFRALSFYKLPFPTYEINSQGKAVFHWIK